MYLKSLVVHGFKSFAQRVELNFLPGVAAVVGPNGSGKSNIADAIRWVLGETSMRSLRGSRVQDIIFLGSDARRPLGMAEVSLTLDNTAGELPISFAEVTITRRVFRSGESHFLINKTPCRLRDIQELFLDSGIGRGSLALIGQGEVDAVLSASPEDRRLLLEDAAGITRYRARKEEALEKLAETADNLLRVNDVITEVSSRLEPLEKAAELAKQHAELSNALDELEAKLYGHEWARLDKQRQSELERQSVAAHAAQEYSERLTAVEQDQARLEADMQAGLHALDTARETLQAAREQEQLHMHAAELSSERITQTERELQRIRTVQTDTATRKETIAAELAEAQEHLAEQSVNTTHSQAQLQELQKQHEELSEQIQVAVTQREAARTEHAKAERSAALWEGELRSSEGESGHAGSRKDRLVERRAAYEAQRLSAAQAVQETQQRVQHVEAQIETLHEQISRGEQEQKEASGQQAELARAMAQHARRYHELDSRRRILVEMANSYEGYFQGVRTVLAAKNEFGSGVLGSVGELVRVPAELDLAMETALGGALQNVVTRTEKEAETAVAYLKRTKGGRATFLPLSSLRYQVFGTAEQQALSHPDVVGVASDLIGFDAEIRPAILYLLGRTVVTRTLQGALQVAKLLRGFQRIVSLEGDLVAPGGAITGGSTSGRSSGILARSRELEELQGQLARLSVEGNQREQQLTQINKVVEAKQAERTNLSAKLHAAEVAKAEAARDLIARNAEMQRLVDTAQSLEEEERLAGEHDRNLAERLERARCHLAEAVEAKARWQLALADAEQELNKYTQAQNVLQQSLTQTRVAAAEAAQRHAAAERDVVRLESAWNEVQAQVDKEAHAAYTATESLVRLKAEAQMQQAIIEKAHNESLAAAETVELARKTVDKLQEAVNQANLAQKQARQEREIALERLHKAEVALTRIQSMVTQVEEKLAALGVNPTKPDGAFDLSAAKRQAEQLRTQIADLGPVNPSAIQEFAESQERCQFLCSQRDDLLAAKQGLEETIAEIDQTSTRRLRDTYEKVSASFAQIFHRLFGGGQARLDWSDDTPLLDAGLELLVQPPGKKMQSLMALSGGERALTAIALLFAIMAVRPSPFCVLDEIDAALDEQNVSRFAGLLDDFAQKSQFVVITHRQATMESADVLYGVTMDRTAVSELISLNIASLDAGSQQAAATAQ